MSWTRAAGVPLQLHCVQPQGHRSGTGFRISEPSKTFTASCVNVPGIRFICLLRVSKLVDIGPLHSPGEHHVCTPDRTSAPSTVLMDLTLMYWAASRGCSVAHLGGPVRCLAASASSRDWEHKTMPTYSLPCRGILIHRCFDVYGGGVCGRHPFVSLSLLTPLSGMLWGTRPVAIASIQAEHASSYAYFRVSVFWWLRRL